MEFRVVSDKVLLKTDMKVGKNAASLSEVDYNELNKKKPLKLTFLWRSIMFHDKYKYLLYSKGEQGKNKKEGTLQQMLFPATSEDQKSYQVWQRVRNAYFPSYNYAKFIQARPLAYKISHGGFGDYVC